MLPVAEEMSANSRLSDSTVFVFGGHGAQHYQMGKTFFEAGGLFAALMRSMDQIVLDATGRSVIAALYGERAHSERFDDLGLTHPAIFMVEYALARTLIERGIEPDMTFGVSLGSMVAATVAGCWSMEAALTIVLEHAAWIGEHCQPGGMIAVLSSKRLSEAALEHHRAVVAASYGPEHFVLAGRASNLPQIEAWLRAEGMLFTRLPVAYPFHSPWLLADDANDTAPPHPTVSRPPRLPLACCAAGGFIEAPSGRYLWEAAVQPIRFDSTLAVVEAKGPHRYIDLSPSGTLASIMRYNIDDSLSSAIPLLGRHGDLASITGAQACRM
jgi:acyl transferase domain-containing protein